MSDLQHARGREYAEAMLGGHAKAYLFDLNHSERLEWLSGFFGYCAGAAGALVGREVSTVLLESIADITTEVAKRREQ